MRPQQNLAWVLGVLMMAVGPPALGGAGGSLDAIFAAWQRRHDHVHSLRCVLTGKRFVPKNGYAPFANVLPEVKGKVVPAQDESYPQRYALSVDFAKGRVRNEDAGYILYDAIGKFTPYQTIWLYDGTESRRLEPRAGNTSEAHTPSEFQPELFFDSEKNAGSAFLKSSENPVFFTCGVVGAQPGLSPWAMCVPPYQDFLRFQGQGRIGVRDCIILRTAPVAGSPLFRDYWVDAARGGAVLRYTVTVQDQLVSQTDIEYEEGQPGGWRPRRWVEVLYKGGSMWRAEDLGIAEWELNPEIPLKEFQAEMRPRMVVYDNRKDKFYRVDEDGRTLNDLVFRGTQFEETVLPRLPWVWWLFGLFDAAVVVALLWLWRRRQRHLRTGR